MTSGPKILVVEDNELNLELAVRKLERRGYTVRSCTDAETALGAIAAEVPDLILMDLGLPGMDGLCATRALKADPKTAGIPVIALTAHAMEADRQKAIEAGCDGYVSKPVDFGELEGIMRKLLP